MRNQTLSIMVKAIRAQSNALNDIINLATPLAMSGLLIMTGLGSVRRISGSALETVFTS
jgi:hypothetical protein